MSLVDLFTSDTNVKYIINEVKKTLDSENRVLDFETDSFFDTYNKIATSVFKYESTRLKHLKPLNSLKIINDITSKELVKYLIQQLPENPPKVLPPVINTTKIILDTDEDTLIQQIQGVSEIEVCDVYMYNHAYNIDTYNDSLFFTVNETNYSILLEHGVYTKELLVKTIQELMSIKSGIQFNCVISCISSKVTIKSTVPFTIDSILSSILPQLGFTGEIYTGKDNYISENPIRLIPKLKINYTITFSSESGNEYIINFPLFLENNNSFHKYSLNIVKKINIPIEFSKIAVNCDYDFKGFPWYITLNILNRFT